MILYIFILCIALLFIYEYTHLENIKKLFIHQTMGPSKKIPVSSFLYTLIYSSLNKESRRVYQKREGMTHLKNGELANVSIRGLKPIFVVNDPTEVRNVMRNIDMFPKSGENPLPVFGEESLLMLTDNKKWSHMRHLMNPLFSRNDLFFDPLVTVISSAVEIISVADNPQHTMKLRDVLQNLALDSLGIGVLGENFHLLEGNQDTALGSCNYMLQNISILSFLFPILKKLPTQKNRKMNQAKEVYYGYINQMIDSRSPTENPDNLLDVLIQCHQKEPENMSRQAIVDNVSLFFVAGQETTANTLLSTLALLSRHPQVQEKLREEILTAGEMSYNTLKEMKYLSYVIDETLRLYPPVVFLTGRVAAEDTVLCDYLIPAGTAVACQVWTLCSDPKVFENPDDFIPERFEKLTKTQRQSIRPFGDGPKFCIGKHFSLLEQKMFLFKLLSQYRVHLTEESKVKISGSFLLSLDNENLDFYFEKI